VADLLYMYIRTFSDCFTCSPSWVQKLCKSCACQKTVRHNDYGENISRQCELAASRMMTVR